ncbi:MAG: sodium:calcium antiporter, partial [Chromatiales bacterium]
MLGVWLQFLLCLGLIGLAGVKLTRYGDVIADKTGLGGSWIGLILIASVTSLPELATGVSAVGWVAVPDIALGDILGSCVFNLLILALLDALHRERSVYAQAAAGHVLTAGFGIVLIGVSGASILLSGEGVDWRIGHV